MSADLEFLVDGCEEKIHFPRHRCTVCSHKFPDVNVPQPQIDAELSAHMIGHYREYIRRLNAVIYQAQRRAHDPLVELATQELDVKFGGLFR